MIEVVHVFEPLQHIRRRKDRRIGRELRIDVRRGGEIIAVEKDLPFIGQIETGARQSGNHALSDQAGSEHGMDQRPEDRRQHRGQHREQASLAPLLDDQLIQTALQGAGIVARETVV